MIITGNYPPNITNADNVFNVTLGEINTYTFEVEDSDNFTVRIEGGTPRGGILQSNGDRGYTFNWMPEAAPSVALTFIAEDDQGAITIHSPLLQVCACFNGGRCTTEGVLTSSQLIQNLTCICTEGMLNFYLGLGHVSYHFLSLCWKYLY